MNKFILFILVSVFLASCGTFKGKDPEIGDLMGKTWILTNIGSLSVQRGIEVTLIFSSESELSGFAGCNEYSSDYNLNGGSFTVSGISTSSDSCAERVMDQEANFIITLEGAESIRLHGSNLVIHSNEIFQKLKFTSR